MNEKEQKIFDIQCESTKALMLAQSLRPIEDDSVYFSKLRLTPISMDAQCLKEDGSIDLNVRSLTNEDARAYNGFRQTRAERIEAEKVEKAKATLTEEKRDKASAAFMGKMSVGAIKAKFKDMMNHLFKPDYAQVIAEGLRKRNEE